MEKDEKKFLTIMGVLLALVLILWIALTCFDLANAATVKVSWTNPSFNSDSLDCMQPDTLSTLTDLKSIKIWRVRYDTMDTLFITEHFVSGTGLPDSGDFNVSDDIRYGELLFKTVDASNNTSCLFSHHTFVVPKTEQVIGPNGLNGSYYRWVRDANGIRQFSTFLGEKLDSVVDFEWGTGSPWPGVVPADSFCARWVGNLMVPTTGTYQIIVSSEDGFRLFIDSQLLRNWWQVTFEQEISTTVNLSAGAHLIELEYFANVGHSACHLRWSGPGISKQKIGSYYLMP